MRQVVTVIVVLLALGVGVGYLASTVAEDTDGFMIGMAIGNPGNNQVELNIEVSIGMAACEPRSVVVLSDGAWDEQSFAEWVAEHFILTDASGTRVQMHKAGWSKLISEKQAMLPDYYLTAKLTPGVTYTLDYRPRRAESWAYRHEFVAPQKEMPFERVTFKKTEY